MTWLWSAVIAVAAVYGLAKAFPIVATVWMMRKITWSWTNQTFWIIISFKGIT